MVNSSPHEFRIHDNTNPLLRNLSNEPVCIEGKIHSPVPSNSWNSTSATFTVVVDGLKSLIGRDMFDQLGIAVAQSPSSSDNQVNTTSPYSEFKEKDCISISQPNIPYRTIEKPCCKTKIS